tara:strand:+ start:510 stop:1142 length:633 start_codon:yes stop_codon:yes gene_type:complete
MANVGQNKINFRNQQDPSAKFISRDMMDGWEISDIDAEGWHQVNASTDKIIQEVTEDVGNGETLELFTTALAVKGKDIVGSILKYGASGDAQIVTTWQYFDSKDTTFDGTGAQTGGEWVDFGTESASSTPQTIDAGDTKFADIVRTGSKLRLKLTITDSGGNGVTASIQNDAIASLNNNVSTYIRFPKDMYGAINDTLENPITITRPDPS